jgi:hypothetical protein
MADMAEHVLNVFIRQNKTGSQNRRQQHDRQQYELAALPHLPAESV